MNRDLGFVWLGSFLTLAVGAAGCTALNDFSPFTFGGEPDAGRSDAGRTDAGDPDDAGPGDAGTDAGMPCAAGCSALDDECNRGECDEATSMCVRVPLADDTGCDDADACTSGDVCGGGTCAGAPIDCSGLTDECNVGTCDATGTCVATPGLDGTECTPTAADACTVGACLAGACAAMPRDCSALDDACHVGTCDLTTGGCAPMALADGTACDDGDACTMDDACAAEVCTGSALVCPPAPDDCNVPTCDPATGACGFVSVPDGTTCEDGLPCTGGDTCSAGTCLPGGPVSFTGDDCADPHVLDGRDGLQTIRGSITSCHTNAGTGSCGGAGVDVVYRLDLGAPRRVRFETVAPAGGAGYDTLLYLRSACGGGAGSEVACDDNGGGAGGQARITALLAPGTYFLFVDAAAAATSAGDFELEVEILAPDACASAVPLALPPIGTVRRISGDTTGATNAFSTTCGGAAESPDHVYEFTVTMPTRVRFQTVTTTGMFDTVLHVRTAPCVDGLGTTLVCNDDFPTCCLSQIEHDFAPGTYYLIVDGFSMGNQGPYTLEIETSPGAVTEWRFTTCGATGATGPTPASCTTAYAGTSLEGGVTVTPGGQQQWTVPVSGTYRIEAVGAQGISAMAGLTGGRGARVEGTFSLTAGEVLTILAGQEGTQDGCNGGGGGGTFVNRPTGLLVAAGGGGGTRTDAMTNGCDGRASQEGGTASGAVASHTCTPRVGGLRQGGIASSSTWGSGGGGMDTPGGSDCGGTGGAAYTAGAGGGTGGSVGGFGGGGSGNGCCGGGGGGGYSGGDGGWVAGGGGSFNSGSAPVNTAGANAGPGGVVIRRL